jgi:hypothetical protein
MPALSAKPSVAQGHPHDESIGPDGARVLVGRKDAKEWSHPPLVELGLKVKANK